MGAVVVAVGVLRALVAWLAQQLPLTRRGVPTEDIRLGLGRSLGLALEFLLAADILNTAVAPTWEAIGKLAAIATIRTLLNYFLALELSREERRRERGPAPDSPPADRLPDERGAGGHAGARRESG